MERAQAAEYLLAADRRVSTPYDGDPGYRIVGWIVRVPDGAHPFDLLCGLHEIELRAKSTVALEHPLFQEDVP